MEQPRPIARGAAAVLAGALACLAAACSGGSETADFTAAELRGGLSLVSGPDGNVVAAKGPDGLVVVDGGSAEHAQALLEFLERQTGERRVATLIDTTWTPDRIGLNTVLGGTDAEIIAHINAGQWLKYGAPDRAGGGPAAGDGPAGAGRFAPLPADDLPTRTVTDDGGTVALGDGEIRLGYLLQAHTDADLYAYFPDANVLVTGPTVRSDGWSQLDWGAGAYLGALLDAYGALLAVADEDTLIVPGSGPVMTRAELADQGEMYTEMYGRISKLVLGAKSPEEAVLAHPTGDYHPDWPDAASFVARAHRSFRTHIRRDPRLGPIP